MKPNQSRQSGRRSSRNPRRATRGRNDSRPHQPTPKKSLWQKIIEFFFRPSQKSSKPASASNEAPKRRAQSFDVTTPKLYVGNLSFEAVESDLSELFNGVGAVRNAEIVTHKDTERSKGFGFVTMTTLEEAKRAIVELHDREFLGRKLVVNGAKSPEREPNYRG